MASSMLTTEQKKVGTFILVVAGACAAGAAIGHFGDIEAVLKVFEWLGRILFVLAALLPAGLFFHSTRRATALVIVGLLASWVVFVVNHPPKEMTAEERHLQNRSDGLATVVRDSYGCPSDRALLGLYTEREKMAVLDKAAFAERYGCFVVWKASGVEVVAAGPIVSLVKYSTSLTARPTLYIRSIDLER